MKVFCMACGRDDFPETEQYGVSTTARDHLRIWHPDEFFTIELAPDGLVIYPANSGCTCEPKGQALHQRGCAQFDGSGAESH